MIAQHAHDSGATPVPTRAIGYCRVSTSEQGDSGLGLAAQRAALEAEAARQGWQLELVQDVASGKSMAGRPALLAALEDLDAGRADLIAVSKLDRLSRSLVDFATLMERAQKRGWGLVAQDVGVDTSSPSGALVASILAATAAWERATIGARTKVALAEARARGTRLGRPPTVGAAARARIVALRAEGRSWRAVAAALEAEGLPTGQGGRWQARTAQRIWLAEQGAAA